MMEYFTLLPENLKTIIMIVISAGMIAVFIMYLRRMSMEKLRRYAYKAMKYAEKNIVGSGRGQERMNWVVRKVRGKIPPIMQPFITDRFIRDTLELWFYCVRDLLDDGKMNGSEEKKPETQTEDEFIRANYKGE